MSHLDTSEDSLDNNDLKCNVQSSLLSHTNEFILNSFLHVSILFAFLSLLFYYLIAPLAKNAFKHEIGHQIIEAIDKAIPIPIDLRTKKTNKSINPTSVSNKPTDALSLAAALAADNLSDAENSAMDYQVQQLPFASMLNITTVSQLKALLSSESTNQIINNYIVEYSKPTTLINLHNLHILDYGYYLSLILFVITFVLIFFIKYSCGSCVNLTKLFLENIITFSFIGFIEFWFFTKYASKFIPAVPSLLIHSAFENVKSYLN